MLEYLVEMMEDANDFCWQSVKAAPVVVLYMIEGGRL